MKVLLSFGQAFVVELALSRSFLFLLNTHMNPSRSLVGVLSVFMIVVAFCRSARADDDVLLQGFYWDAPQGWYKTLKDQVPDLQKAGFTAVWLPPPSKGKSGASSNGYDVYDHYDVGEFDQKGTIATRWGTKQDLIELIQTLHSAGMKAIADIVMNQMSGADAQEKNSIDGKMNWSKFDYGHSAPDGAPDWSTVESRLRRAVPHGLKEPYLFKKTAADFHPTNEHPDFNAPQHNPEFGPDLCQQHDWINVGLKLWGDWLINSLGYDGFRIDFAKGLDEGYVNEWVHDGAKNGKFAVMEVWDSLDTIDRYVHQTGAHAFDFPLFYVLSDMCNDAGGGFDMRKLDGAGFAAKDPRHAVTFVENHDTDRGGQRIVTDKMMAYAFTLALEVYPSVFYKDYVNYGLKPRIDPLIAIHKRLAGGGLSTLYADRHLFIAQRAGEGSRPGLVLVLNNDPQQWESAWISAKSSWSGRNLRDYAGKAPNRHVAGDGRVELSAPPRGYAVYSLDGADIPPARAD